MPGYDRSRAGWVKFGTWAIRDPRLLVPFGNGKLRSEVECNLLVVHSAFDAKPDRLDEGQTILRLLFFDCSSHLYGNDAEQDCDRKLHRHVLHLLKHCLPPDKRSARVYAAHKYTRQNLECNAFSSCSARVAINYSAEFPSSFSASMNP
jgi:hypothetical protein